MLNAYETKLLSTYLANLASVIDHRSPQAEEFMDWAEQIDQIIKYGGSTQRSRRRPRYDRDDTPVPAKRLRKARETLSARCSSGSVRPDRTAQRLRRLGKTTDLNSLDIEILELVLRHETNQVFDSMIDDIFDCPGLHTSTLNLSGAALPMLLGQRAGKIQSRLRKGAPLVRSGLVRVENDGDLEIPDRLKRLVHQHGNDRTDITKLLFDSTSPSELEWSDFDHIVKDRGHIENLLKGSLRNRAKGVNILLYGPPGTGKTEFCKVLAERLDVDLYSVGEADEDGSEPSRNERVQELTIAQRLLSNNRKSLLLFDEMEDLLGGMSDFLAMLLPHHQRGFSKVYMHRLLEQAPVPTLWTMNNANSVSPAILRRMMFALELRPPSAKVRTRVWTRQLDRNGFAATPDEVRELASEFEATPAIAAGATAAARIGGGDLATVRHGVHSLSKLLSCNKPPQKAPPEFDLELIQADTDPKALADKIVSTERRDFSFCLQGPPGTGKSAFIRYLAERLGLEVIQKRASDLMSMWVGQTEKLISQAFAEARDSEAFLIFDEADSLLADRRKAVRNWEISQVNEMLTWMENHPMPFACTTNFSDNLDEATLRRFTFKVALDYLTPEQARAAFGRFFALEPTAELARLPALTPGDFAVVRSKADILGCLREPETLVEMLSAECGAKTFRPKAIGFHA